MPSDGNRENSHSRSLRRLLSGGDRRSIAQVKKAREIICESPARVAALAALAEDNHWLVSMRALDLLEKLAYEHPEWIQPYKRLFIGSLADSEQWEIRLQIVRVLPLLRWTSRERRRVIDILQRDLSHPKIFVKAWALSSLAVLAQSDRSLVPEVIQHLETFERSKSKALQARSRKIRDQISRDGLLR